MPFRIVQFEATPNPNALMCRLDQPICIGTLSYTLEDRPARTSPHGAGAVTRDRVGGAPSSSDDGPPEEARRAETPLDPVVEALLAVRGVQRLMLRDHLLTITKAPGANWAKIREEVAHVLERAEPLNRRGF